MDIEKRYVCVRFIIYYLTTSASWSQWLIRTCSALGKSIAVSSDFGGVGVLFSDQNVEGTSSHRHRVLSDMNLVDTVLMRHEPHRTLTCAISTIASTVIIIIIPGYCIWRCHHDSVTVIARVHPINAEQRQTAANLWTKPTDLSRRSACRQHCM